MTDNFEKDINVPSKRPPYEIALMHDHILRLEEELKAKEQECEELKNELHKNFKEKDTLHLIIDRLLEASGYDTNTASAEEFEDVYEHMRYEQQQLDQLKAENDELKKKCNIYTCGICGNKEDCNKLYKTLTEIKEICKKESGWVNFSDNMPTETAIFAEQILQKISECEVK